MDIPTYLTNNFRIFVDLVSALAWPFVVFGIVFLLRKELQALIRNIKRITYPGGQTDIDRNVGEISRNEIKVARQDQAEGSFRLSGEEGPQGKGRAEVEQQALPFMTPENSGIVYDLYAETLKKVFVNHSNLNEQTINRSLGNIPQIILYLSEQGVITVAERDLLIGIWRLNKNIQEMRDGPVKDDNAVILADKARAATKFLKNKFDL